MRKSLFCNATKKRRKKRAPNSHLNPLLQAPIGVVLQGASLHPVSLNRPSGVIDPDCHSQQRGDCKGVKAPILSGLVFFFPLMRLPVGAQAAGMHCQGWQCKSSQNRMFCLDVSDQRAGWQQEIKPHPGRRFTLRAPSLWFRFFAAVGKD